MSRSIWDFSHKHGDSRNSAYTKLCKQWIGMRKRAKKRKDCNVFPEWEDYAVFKAWSLANGYSEVNNTFCRNGDKGDYSPDNARWDTKGNNSAENFAKCYNLCLDGKLVEIHNMASFCRGKDLDASTMMKVAKGKRKSYKGYTRWLNINQSV